MSVSLVEGDNNDDRGGDLESERVEQERGGGDAWDNMMKPFDQDAEEQKDKEEKEDGELASEEAARAKIVKPGYHPTSKEIAEHMVNHLPYRAWCKHCIKGKAKGLPHRKIGEEVKVEETLPVVSFDYMFMDDDRGSTRKRVCQS